MALPAGTTYAVVTVGIPVSFSGAALSIDLTVKPTVDELVHTSTGTPVLGFVDTYHADAGSQITFQVPHVNQTGYQLPNGTAFTMWAYTVTGRFSDALGNSIAFVKNFQPMVGQVTIDLDLTNDGALVSPVGAVIPAVTSVNGQTGAVTVAGGSGGTPDDGSVTNVKVAVAAAITLDKTVDSAARFAMTSAQVTKLSGIATAATANAADAVLEARANHTGTQSADTLTDGTTNKAFLATERTKLTGIATAATANSADAVLEARANHTGTQLSTTISDFSTAADARITAAGGVSIATLVAGKIPSSQIPAVGLVSVQVAASQAAQLALTTQEGDVVTRSDTLVTYMRNAGVAGTMADFTLLNTPTGSGAVASVNGFTGTVVLAKADVGLGNVDNTTDVGKPVSTLQAAADALKANIASPTFTGVPAAPTATGGTNTTQVATTAFVAAAVTGLAPTAAPTFTGVPAAPTASAGTNTTQLATTAFVTTADNLKANLASPTFTGTPAAPTAAAATNTTQVATTAFIQAAITALFPSLGTNAWRILGWGTTVPVSPPGGVTTGDIFFLQG